MTEPRPLDQRLAAAGVEPGSPPLDAWRRLHDVEGPRATVLDLYELVARERGMVAHELPREERYALARSVLPDVWSGFATTAGSERRDPPIRIVEYDAEWSVRFERWRQVLRDALGATARRIEHVGSTSVRGLPAKAIVDIQISVVDLADESSYVPPIEASGLQLRSRDDLHRYFRPYPDRPRDVHVHVCALGSTWEADHLRFRDHLRARPEARDAYAQVKRDAAARWGDDGIAYTDAKTAVILELLASAD